MEGNEPKVFKTAQKILDLLSTKWPLNPMEVAELLGDNKNVKTSSSK